MGLGDEADGVGSEPTGAPSIFLLQPIHAMNSKQHVQSVTSKFRSRESTASSGRRGLYQA